MMKETKEMMLISSSPQIHNPQSTVSIMWTVSLCLLPAGIWGVYVFGIRALWVLMASIAAAMATEGAFNLAQKRVTLFDGSAFLTGLLIGYNMPPAVPFFIPVVASVFAVGVVKWSFGGLGANWMNPALAGRVFVFFSWTGAMTTWTLPRTWQVDAVTGASPLGALKSALMTFEGQVSYPMQLLESNGMVHSAMDLKISSWLNEHIFSLVGSRLPAGYTDLFLGNIPGCIGEVSALLLLAGTIYLVATDIINWEIPASYFGSFILLVWIFGGLPLGNGVFSGDILFHLMTGGLILGVFYMATDMVTSPLTRKGMLIYGAGAGFLTFLIRIYGSFPEGVSLAIILMNIFVPLINRYTRPSRYGLVPEEKEEK